MNYKRSYQDTEHQSEEKDKFEFMARLLQKLAELQSDLAQQYFNGQGSYSRANHLINGESEFLHFRTIQMNQLL